jgi:nucleoside-diphosphate-sugar epimerase
MNKKIFITGGAGYCGSVLVSKLLGLGHEVTVFDTLFFGYLHLPLLNKNLNIIHGDIRDSELLDKSLSIKKYDIFINLACISNDASFEIDEKLSTLINLNAFEPMVKIVKKNKVDRFIYASSSSVYGVSDQKDVKEDHPLVPLTLYNKYKGECEPLLKRHIDDNFTGVIFRPATVCGFSPRLRLDLSVNILTHHAYVKNLITVFGGEQLRPNLHIKDYCDVVLKLMEADKTKINGETFNVGSQNLKIKEIAYIIKEIFEKKYNRNIDIKLENSDDKRSYHINSDKIFEILGFRPKYKIEDAVYDLITAFNNGLIHNSINDINFYNIKKIKTLLSEKKIII